MGHQIFAPHGMCMMWNQPLIWLHVITDSLVAVSYYSIPAALFALALKKRESVPVRPLLILFGLFIAFCGAGHVMDIVSIWHPIYWLKGFWNTGTALTSVVTAIVLVPKVAEFVSMPEKAAKLLQEKKDIEEKHGILRAVVDSVSEGILLVDELGRRIAANPAATALLGDADVVWPGHAASDQDVQTREDGRIVERFTKRIPGVGQLYVLRDISAQRRSEESRMRLENVIATMKQGFCIVSVDDEVIRTSNASFDAMHGYEVGQLGGRKVSELYAAPDNAQAIRQTAETEGFWEGEIESRRKDGSTFPVAARVNLHRGEPNGLLSFIQVDITEQRNMADEAAKLQAKLLQAQKLESLGVLAGGVAHDFNNLLTGIMGNASLALDSLSPAHAMRPRLKDVLKASERAADLTRQLLAYSGKGRFVIEPIDISALVDETNALVQISVPRTVQLRLKLDPNLPRVEADASQLQQLIMNLVINAAEAIGENPGIVQVTTGVQRLDQKDIASAFADESLKPASYVYIEVQDNGSGMDERTRSQIFDPFFTTKFTGRGLGLAAALGIVRGHGGALRVYSVLGEGSTFKVFLPIWHGDAEVTMVSEQPSDLHGSATILVVDDEDTVRATTYSALSHYGYKVLVAENGLQAVQILEGMPHRIDLVLLDMTMPVMSGEEALRRLRKIRPGIPIVLTSGFNESEAVQKFAGKGLSGFLQKPYTASQLAEMVKSAVPA